MVKVSALFSGGKDSTYATYLLQQQGWEIASLLTVIPSRNDSYMYHYPNINWTRMQADALRMDIRTTQSDGDQDIELVDLERLMAKEDVDGFVSGAIASDYQWSRLNELCDRLDKPLFSPLWRKDQRAIFEDMLKAGFRIIVSGTYAEGLDEAWLGREIDDDAFSELCDLGEEHGFSVSGEGGEIETFVTDGPNFSSSISIKRAEKRVSCHTGVYEIIDAGLE
ncbi:MAG: diphthine--ammonia ligase [Methanobacteriota archaeon]|nr:MAG: diphthine--ammonia ligase [Euryarchaeota archaeon]